MPNGIEFIGSFLKLRLGEQADRQRSLRNCKQRCQKPLTELRGNRCEVSDTAKPTVNFQGAWLKPTMNQI